MSMRILYFANTFPSLSETFVLHEITSLIARGHDITVIARRGDGHRVHKALGMISLEQIRYVPPMEHRLERILRTLPVLGRSLRDRPLTTLRTLDVISLGVRALSLEPLRLLDVFRKDWHFDVAHAHFGAAGVSAALLKATGAIRCPVVTTFHDVEHWSYMKSWGANALEPLWKHGDLFLMASDGCRQRLVEHGCPANRARTLRVGVDVERLRFEPTRTTNGPWELLFVGRLTQQKGCHILLQALRILIDQDIDILLRVIGDGPDRHSMETLASTLELGTRLTFCGAKSNEEVVQAMRSAQAVIVPSIVGDDGKEEVIPVTLIESMALGTPVITTPNGQICELVEHNVSGLITTEGDAEALASAILRLLGDAELGKRLAESARKVVESRHNHSTQIDTLEHTLRKLAQPEDSLP